MTLSKPLPRVSVIVNTYNHEKFLGRALQSVADQDFPSQEVEIIVVDDGSTDATPQIASEFLPSIRYIRQRNGGQVSAFLTGIAEARGEILVFLDGDDWWARHKLSGVMDAFDADPSIAAVGHGYYEVDEKGEVTGTMSPDSPVRLSLESPEKARHSATFRTFLGTSRFAIRRMVLQQTLPVPPELPFFDNFVFSQAIAISGAQILPEPLCYYRIHSGSLYAGASDSRARLRMKHK
ncbi:MAG: glycosyltransferase family 2 protein, partial [Candidatus Acidiferrales bacterium]